MRTQKRKLNETEDINLHSDRNIQALTSHILLRSLKYLQTCEGDLRGSMPESERPSAKHWVRRYCNVTFISSLSWPSHSCKAPIPPSSSLTHVFHTWPFHSDDYHTHHGLSWLEILKLSSTQELGNVNKKWKATEIGNTENPMKKRKLVSFWLFHTSLHCNCNGFMKCMLGFQIQQLQIP